MTQKISRHFVTVGARRVHYARAGEGPVVVLLHASPVSFKASEIVQRVYAERFTALAFDTPGFGLSDPLPLEQPEIEDFADALAETLTALSIDRVAVHGRHTGAQIAVEFAARHPDRCSMAITDGFPIFSETVRQSRPGAYLLPIVPRWDGSHLLWLWYRYREQYVFWPWNLQDPAHRADCDMPEPAFIHRGVVEFLEAGDSYRIGYSSAYRHRGLDALPDLKVPVCFGWRPGDSLFEHRDRLPEDCWSETFPRAPREAAQAEMTCLLKHPGQMGAPAAPICQPITGRSTTDYIDVGAARVLVRRRDALQSTPPESDLPIVLLHPLPGSSALLESVMATLSGTTGRTVVSFDLPGQGESISTAPIDHSIPARAQTALAVLDALGVARCDLLGHQGGACVAVEMMRIAPDRIGRLVLDAPACLPPSEREAIAQKWLDKLGATDVAEDGFHLLRLWHMRRDMSLWWPWYDRTREHTRAGQLSIDAESMTVEIREMIKQPAHIQPALASVLNYPMFEHLSALNHSTALISRATDPWAPGTAWAAEAIGLPRPGLHDTDQSWLDHLIQALRQD